MQNAAIKNDSRYMIKIVHDEDAESPREWDNLGKMICWHTRYNLGDKHEFNEPLEFKKDLVRETVPPNEIIAFVKDGNTDDLTLTHNAEDDTWVLKSYWDYAREWYEEYVAENPLDINDTDLSDAIIENMGHGDLEALAEKYNLIQPLFLYDHSILSMSTSSFLGRAQHADWDSGQTGYVYVSHKDIAKEYGDASPENIEKARKLINSEVETYDSYLRGECYGFQLYENGKEIDSCWGFIGSFDEAKESIRGYIPEEAAPLIDDMQYGDEETEIEDESEVEV